MPIDNASMPDGNIVTPRTIWCKVGNGYLIINVYHSTIFSIDRFPYEF